MSTNLALHAIQSLQAVMESEEFQSTDMDQFTDHFFAPGIYVRTLFIPAGFVVVGACHKHEALNILLKGEISVVNEHGERILAKAPFIFKSKNGQKAGFAITDVWYASIHPNPDDITDVKQLEAMNTLPRNLLEATS